MVTQEYLLGEIEAYGEGFVPSSSYRTIVVPLNEPSDGTCASVTTPAGSVRTLESTTPVASTRARAAAAASIDRLVAHWLVDRIGADFSGRISGVTGSGLFVKLDETGADGLIPISTLGDDYFLFDETLGLLSIAGMLMCIGGVYLVNRPRPA